MIALSSEKNSLKSYFALYGPAVQASAENAQAGPALRFRLQRLHRMCGEYCGGLFRLRQILHHILDFRGVSRLDAK